MNIPASEQNQKPFPLPGMTQPRTYSWILLSIDSPAARTRREISEMADAINHAVPTHLEMETSLRWLQNRGFIHEDSGRFAVTQKGAEMITSANAPTIHEKWHNLTAAIQPLVDEIHPDRSS